MPPGPRAWGARLHPGVCWGWGHQIRDCGHGARGLPGPGGDREPVRWDGLTTPSAENNDMTRIRVIEKTCGDPLFYIQ